MQSTFTNILAVNSTFRVPIIIKYLVYKVIFEFWMCASFGDLSWIILPLCWVFHPVVKNFDPVRNLNQKVEISMQDGKT